MVLGDTSVVHAKAELATGLSRAALLHEKSKKETDHKKNTYILHYAPWPFVINLTHLRPCRILWATPVAAGRINTRASKPFAAVESIEGFLSSCPIGRAFRSRPDHLHLQHLWLLARAQGLASQTPSEIYESALQGVDSVQDTEIGLGLQRGQGAPRDQEYYYREDDAGGKLRPQFTAKQNCLKTDGNGERYYAIDR